MKRVLDVVVSAMILVALSPVMLAVALAVKLSSPGPVIFRQTRIGQNGRSFVIFKFRTMHVAKTPTDGAWDGLSSDQFRTLVYHGESDPRITSIGHYLRKSSLDELPQLFNVLNGTMSLVGPRPEIPELVSYYDDVARQRLNVKPGITGLAQISGRSDLSMERKIEFDLRYVHSVSLWGDLRILLKTAWVVIFGRGAR